MSVRPVRAGLVLALFLGLLAGTAAQEKAPKLPESVQKRRKVIEDYLKKVGGSSAQIVWKDDKALQTIFPDTTFFAARFRIYPIARVMPEGMKPSNVFAVGAAGKAEWIKDASALHKYFMNHAEPVKTDKNARAALASWLDLSQEFHQDGFYKFEVLAEGFALEKKDGQLAVRGRALVKQGGNGEINANLKFGSDGKMIGSGDMVSIRQGPRPICQATLLLDANPLVRRIAEQDLLIMGLAARDYLREQRERAGPALRQAIDRVAAQIERNGW